MSTESVSIHPGVVDGARRHPKVNTCGNSSLYKRLERQLAGIEKHLEANPKDALSLARVGQIKQILRGGS